MTTTDINPGVLQEVQNFVLQRIKTAGSQNMAARQLGISPSMIIHYKNAKWEYIGKRTFNLMLSKAGLTSWREVMTDNLKIASSILKEAQESSRFLALTGFTGSGKTTTLKLYANRTEKAYYVLADSEMNKSRFLLSICKAVGVPGNYAAAQLGERLNVICRRLNSEERPLLIIDDAGKLTDANIRMIQIIYDRTEDSAGILIAGTEYLKKSIERKARLDKMGYRELLRRIAYWQEMEPIPVRDVETICESCGITDAQAIKYLAANCNDFGTLKNMIKNVVKLSKKEKAPVTREMLTMMNGNRDWWQGVSA